MESLKAKLLRILNSPTAATWVSLFTRSVSLVLVLPLVLRKFSAPEAAVWFVFSTVLAMQGMLGFGFSPSFSRLLAYARAGARVEEMYDLRQNQAIGSGSEINWDSIAQLISCMRRVFLALAVVSLLLMGSAGTLVVWHSIALAGHQSGIWTAWGIVVIASSLSFFTIHYLSILQGMNRVADWRRMETLTSLGSILTSFLVLLAGGKLLSLVIANQIWVLISLLVFGALCRKIENGKLQQLSVRPWDKNVFNLVWSSAWKSGITGVMTFGLVQSTGIIQAQFGTATSTATYNFMLRIFTMIGQVVQAPLLTKLPELARLRAAGDLAKQMGLIKRGMRLAHWSVVVAVAGGALAMPFLLKYIGSKSVVFDPLLWAIFGLNLFLDRHGGMLHAIRNLTNKPLEQYAMLGYFTFCVSFTILFLNLGLSLYAYPLAMLATQVVFAEWLATWAGYRTIGVKFFDFEKNVAIPPFAILLMLLCFLIS